MIRICTSHRTEVLLDAFAVNLTDERKRHGPFAPVRVVVPNRNVETYLRLELCERCGIAANLEMTFLRRFLATIAETASREGAHAGTSGVRVADAAHVEGHLLALLHDDAWLGQPDLADVRRYLGMAAGDRDALDRRRCQLAGQLAQLFEEYGGSRPDMLSAWARGGAGAADHAASAWQRALWLAVFGPDGRLARPNLSETDGTRYQSLDALWSLAMQQKPGPLAGRSVHVFGLSYVAPAYHRMLAELGRETDVLIYTLNPCEEDSDQLTAAAGSVDSEDPFGLTQERQLALRLWARPGRESLRLLAAMPDALLDSRFATEDETQPTLLHRLQEQIVRRGSPGKSPAPQGAEPPDDSLRVIPCPSLRRELEVVAAEIWALVRKDPSLQLTDVAVIVPEASKDAYLTQLSAVFRESAGLPHNVADLPATAGHRALQAIGHLLDLPFSSMSRKEVMPLLTHPCVMARFPDASPELWCELADQLGIVRGADRSDFDPHYPERDLFSWDQGLRRLTLGAFADGADADDPSPLSLGGESYLPGPPIASDDGARLGFGLLARSLLADARFAWNRARPPERPLRQWIDFVRGMVDSYVVLDDEDGAGQAAVAEFLHRLEALAEIGLGGQPVSYRVVAELAKRELGGLPWSRGRYLSGGVTVASFVPMRAIPFRAVFVLGLGQGAFPRPAGRSELDLRQGSRRAGDVDRREQDLYMFLETLLSARDHVVLSYVARDEVTGEELPASSVLLELRSILGQHLMGAAALDRLFCKEKDRRPPLRRHDDNPERREVLPAAEAEHRARVLGQMVRPQPYDPTPVADSLASLPDGSRSALDRVLAVPYVPKPAPERAARAIAVPLTALRRFLEDPLQGSARFRLGLRDDDEGLADVEDEPFDLDNRDRTALLSGSMTAALLGAQSVPSWEEVSTAYQRKMLAAELAGKCPTGLFRESETRRQEEALAVWQRELVSVVGPGPVHMAPVRFCAHADDRDDASTIAVRPAPQLSIGSNEVHIIGRTGFLVRHADATAISLAFSWRAEVDEDALGREDLRAFLDYVVLSAAGPENQRAGHRSALCFRSSKRANLRVCALAPLERTRALAYLAVLCRELLAASCPGQSTGLHPYLLPHEAVLASRQRGTSVRDEIERLCDETNRAGFSSLRGPVPDVLARYAAPPTDQVERMVSARFGLFFDLLREAEG